MNTTDSTTSDRTHLWRRSARRAWTGAAATALAGLAAGFLLPTAAAGLVSLIAMATANGLTARAAYRHGQLHVLTRLDPATGHQPR